MINIIRKDGTRVTVPLGRNIVINQKEWIVLNEGKIELTIPVHEITFLHESVK